MLNFFKPWLLKLKFQKSSSTVDIMKNTAHALVTVKPFTWVNMDILAYVITLEGWAVWRVCLLIKQRR